MSIAVCCESEGKLKMNRSVSEYYFNLMSGTKRTKHRHYLFPQTGIFYWLNSINKGYRVIVTLFKRLLLELLTVVVYTYNGEFVRKYL